MKTRMTAASMALVSGWCASGALAQSDVLALDLRAAPNRLLRFPVNAPANTMVAPVTPDIFAMDYDRSATTLYAITFATPGTHQLGTIDETTGTFTPIAA